MKIKNVTRADLDTALAKINETYGDNIEFNNITPTNNKKTAWSVTLRAKSSRGAGARRALNNKRHTVSACWHVHGIFLDALPADARFYTMEIVGSHPNGADKTELVWRSPGDAWVDPVVGSLWTGLNYFSELCNCGEDGLA
jgi:hypothetical protein